MARKVKGGWRADAKGTDVKGGRKREGGEQEKVQEEDGDHPRAVENNRESQNLQNAKAPRYHPKHLLRF